MTIGKQTHKSFSIRWRRNWSTCKSVYLLLIPLLAYYIIFHYIPMGGTVIAFQNYKPALGLTRSKWVGLKHFVTFFKGPYAWRVIRNTLVMNALQILFAFPAPISSSRFCSMSLAASAISAAFKPSAICRISCRWWSFAAS